MRLSETGQPRANRKQQMSRFRKMGLSAGMLVVLVAAAIGAISLGRHLVTHAAAQVNQDCTLIVPANPLSAAGLATPYQLMATNPAQGPCNEANTNQSAFVQGAVLDPATGQISVYNPLVIDQGTQPAATPVTPNLPANAVVALWFGSNATTLRLQGQQAGTLNQGQCVNGRGNSVFGQFAYCNAVQFFSTANTLIQAGTLTPPALGTGNDGLTCPTTRDFSVVDQDQSDNVTTTYLVTQDGHIAQNTAANQAALAGAQTQVNGSDERLLSVALDGALGCTPWMAPDLANNGAMVPALPLNELQAAQDQKAPIALVPQGDPMTLVAGNPNQGKVNLYRQGVDQQTTGAGGASTTTYCQNLLQVAPARLQKDMQFTMNRPSPDAAAANNLFTFLAQRFNATFGPNNLNCTGLLGVQNPITLQQDGNGVTIAATINLNGQGGNNGG
jgi:hypothetical protein